MLRFTFFPVLLLSCAVAGQPKPEQLQLAEEIEAFNPAQSANLARKVFAQAVLRKDYRNACLAGILLGKSYHSPGNYKLAIYYDSLAVLYAGRQADRQLQQKAINSYTSNFVDQFQFSKAEALLAASQSLLTGYSSPETCLWYEMKALCYFDRMRLDSAILACRTAISIAQQLPDSANQMHAQILLGKFYTITLRTDSIGPVYEALHYFDRTKNYRYAAQAANSIGYNFETVNSPDKAIFFYEKAQAYFRLLTDTREVILTGIRLGDAYLLKKDTAIARAFFESGYRYYTTTGNQKGMADVCIRLGKIHTEANRYDSAWYYFKKAETANGQLQLPAIKFILSGLEGQLLARQKNGAAADSLTEAAINMALEMKDQLPTVAMQKRLLDKKTITKKEAAANNRFAGSKPFVQQQGTAIQSGDYQRVETLNWHTGGDGHNDSNDLETARRQAYEIEAQYKTRILSDSLQLQKQQTDLNESTIRTRNITLAATAALLLLVATGGYLQYRSRQRAEQDKARIELLQNEIHHRVKNNLAVVNRLVDVAGKNSVEDVPLSALKTRIKSIELLHSHLYSREAAAGNIALQPYLSDLCLAIAATFHTAKSISIHVNAPVEVDSAIAEKLGLIVNELVTNSYKYAFENRETGTVNITARQEAGTLTVRVTDNGIGMPETKAGNSYGMKLIKGLSHELKGRFAFHNSNGTRFEITIPVTA